MDLDKIDLSILPDYMKCHEKTIKKLIESKSEEEIRIIINEERKTAINLAREALKDILQYYDPSERIKMVDSKTSEIMFAIFAAINLLGKELEKIDELDLAIKLYEINLINDFEGGQPYDRLVVLYRKQKKKDQVIRVLEKAVKVQEKIYQRLIDDLGKSYVNEHPGYKMKLEKYKNQLEKAKDAKDENIIKVKEHSKCQYCGEELKKNAFDCNNCKVTIENKNEYLQEERKCPYCHKVLSKVPSRKSKCPHCENVFYVRTRTSDRKKVIVTEQGAKSIEQEWEKFHEEQLVQDLENLPKDMPYYNKLQCIAKAALLRKDNDKAWSYFNQAKLEAMKAGQFETSRNITLRMTEQLIGEGHYKQALFNLCGVIYYDICGVTNADYIWCSRYSIKPKS